MLHTLFGHCIYTSPSGYKVYQNRYYRWLTLGNNTLHTVINIRYPERPILYYIPSLILMAKSIPGSVCMLGLGGGAVAHTLLKNNTSFKISAVEISEEVITIAQRFFMIDTLQKLTVLNQNAIHFLHKNTVLFTHVLVDLYNADSFPEDCYNQQFFDLCKTCLHNHGFLAVNIANSTEQYAIFLLIKNSFSNTIILPNKKSNNIIVIANNHLAKIDFFKALQQTQKIKNISLTPYWGCTGKSLC